MYQIYQRKHFKIYKADDGIILHNSRYEFATAHTHLKSVGQAKLLIQYSLDKRVPRDLSLYLLISLLRINSGADCPEYSRKISELIENKKQRQSYYNRAGRCRINARSCA